MHIPVLLEEVTEALKWETEDVSVLDLTLGGAGHLLKLLNSFPKPRRIVAVDQDPEAIERGRELLKGFPVEFYHGNYSEFLASRDETFDRILMDCGVSSFQLDQPERGFSFRQDGPLDMRMDPTKGEPVWKWLERCSEKELADVIWKYGEDRKSRLWARRWVHARKFQKVRTTREFVEALGFTLESRDRRGHHPLTRVFQALRMHVNQELEHLRTALQFLPSRLNPSGRLAIISFHSLEDREVKWGLRGKLKAVNKKVIVASEQEQKENPRSRSAKLRVFTKDESLESRSS